MHKDPIGFCTSGNYGKLLEVLTSELKDETSLVATAKEPSECLKVVYILIKSTHIDRTVNAKV